MTLPSPQARDSQCALLNILVGFSCDQLIIYLAIYLCDRRRHLGFSGCKYLRVRHIYFLDQLPSNLCHLSTTQFHSPWTSDHLIRPIQALATASADSHHRWKNPQGIFKVPHACSPHITNHSLALEPGVMDQISITFT